MTNALLLGYGLEQPSYRHRMRSLIEPLRSAGWQVRAEQFPGGRYGVRTWERRSLLRWADVTVLHQIKLSAIEARLFAAFSRRRVFDVDDAIYVRKPRRLGEPPDESAWRMKKFAATCRWVDAVAAGNDVLAGVAEASAAEVVVLPTSIDAASYRPTSAGPADPPTVAWIGSPENLIYLDIIRPALVRLSKRHPALRLRVICSAFPHWGDVQIERVTWSSATEAQSLAGAHIGVMPLTDDAWSRGKCAFKLLQYMAAALPCVASPVGANTEAVVDGVNGFHASDIDEWERSLEKLIVSPNLRAAFGAAGRLHVEQRYSMRSYHARYLQLLGRLALP
ncbi:MAG TPA: glycosyltransferase family 4 protein [Steroidobacteraceae bacterium]|jgi:glycosyltransferase involved in cell wall biosynthesis|nr:glycosyltransferase family 4 protein [Steroidobacteraceae bacterium]